MSGIEEQLDTRDAVGVPSEPADLVNPEVLIPEVRRHTRHRRLRNLAIVAALAAIVAGLITNIGSGSPASQKLGRSTAPRSPWSTHPNPPAVSLKQPSAIAVGPGGALYVADAGRQQILRRLPSGQFVVFAGTGVAGYSGDGARATSAEIDSPSSLAVGAHRVLYFAQTGSAKMPTGVPTDVVREVLADGEITTVIGQSARCVIEPRSAGSLPAGSAELNGAQLTIGRSGLLDISTTLCPNAVDLGGYFELTSAGRLIRTAADSVRGTSGYCGGGVAGPGFMVFGCASGARRGPRLMVVSAGGRTASYPDVGSQPNDMSATNGTVVAIHNRAVVRVTVDGLERIASADQIVHLVRGAVGVVGDAGIAVSREGSVYAVEDLLVRPHGCTSIILRIGSNGRLSALWRSAANQTCF